MEFNRNDLDYVYAGLNALYKQLDLTYAYMRSDVFTLEQRTEVMKDMVHVDKLRALIMQKVG